MVFLLIIGNSRVLKNWVIKPSHDISENSEEKKKWSYFMISVQNVYN